MKNKSSILKWILIGVVVCLVLAFPAFAKNRYQVHIVNNIGIWILLSLGLNIAQGYGGQFNLYGGVIANKIGSPILDQPAAGDHRRGDNGRVRRFAVL